MSGEVRLLEYTEELSPPRDVTKTAMECSTANQYPWVGLVLTSTLFAIAEGMAKYDERSWKREFFCFSSTIHFTYEQSLFVVF
jgi:hypothetical protein